MQHTGWKILDPPFIPSNHLPTLIQDEPAEEYEAIRKIADNNRLCDMELLTRRSQRAKEAIDRIDAKAEQITQHSAKQCFLELWTL